MSKLLINESPLVLLPSLAVKVGLNQAIVIQQIHYWLQASKTKINGQKWVYNTIDEWLEQFPFFSRSTLERTISSLVKDGFLIVEKLSTFKSDRTNYYTIDYVKLNESSLQNDVTNASNCGNHNVKMTESTITSNCGNGYTESTETTTETTTDIINADAQKTTKVGLKDLLALGVEQQTASDWLEVRRLKRAALTQTVINLLVKESAKANISVNDAVRICAENSWQGFKADWYFNLNKQSGNSYQSKEDERKAYNKAAQEEFLRSFDSGDTSVIEGVSRHVR